MVDGFVSAAVYARGEIVHAGRARGKWLALHAKSGYILARMRYEIILAPQAVEDLNALRADVRSVVRDALETHLRFEPTKTSRSRIKRLRGLSRPQYRLRIDEIRIFYDVVEDAVEILAIVPKSSADDWLRRAGEPDETGRAV